MPIQAGTSSEDMELEKKSLIVIKCRYNNYEDYLELSFVPENVQGESNHHTEKFVDESRISIIEDERGRITTMKILQASKIIVRKESTENKID